MVLGNVTDHRTANFSDYAEFNKLVLGGGLQISRQAPTQIIRIAHFQERLVGVKDKKHDRPITN